ncbi:PIR protein [Plasmodium ovale]|uniref:PIR protein n=1 Tax=Plasmodium ovale TaxID=36330 RepID=A0A1D3JGH5_PLAOA|nr:PIR protein [Plasmodium ovale]
MVNKDEEEIGALEDEGEEEEDEDEDEEYSLGDTYYSSVRTFQKYEDEFKKVTVESDDKKKYKILCDSYNNIYFSGINHNDRCYTIAKYLKHIKEKDDDDTVYRCKCLNYLLHTNQIFRTYPDNNISKLFRSYKKLSSKFEICDRTIEHIKYEDVLENIRKLYDLNNAMDKLEYSLEHDKGNISKNAEKFAEIYRNSRDKCSTDNISGYCSELKVYEKYCYERTKPENYTESLEILKSLIPKDRTSSIIVSFIMILGIPFFLYILYKFSPLGSWTNIQLQKSKKMWNNLSENEHNLNISRHDQLNMKNSKFNIKYHSA